MDDVKLYRRNDKGLDSLVQKIRAFSEDTWMELGIEKCAMLVIEKGKIVKSVGKEWPDGKVIKSLEESESYWKVSCKVSWWKFLEILESDRFLGENMKLKVSEEYFRRLVFISKLNGRNLVQGVNTWAVSLLRYSAAFIKVWAAGYR